MSQPITITATINAPIEKVWEYWNGPEHIPHWAFASDEWEAPFAETNLQVGGKFKTVMAAKDKSASFDFTGTYTAVRPLELIEYDMTLAPGEPMSRHVKVEFAKVADGVKITESFDPENQNPIELQQNGWQAMLNNFKKYVENN